ncbi:hypothetical protein [Salinibacter ruber]|uniref:hypothetical protein n=1 Tax=Salinibacter ruber TaxID=146919 RepID=UPI00216945FA|nr:hypothetical protein [Salinibacter ruber]MCS4099927.1 hypothetical protein [Salinibacter ruber]
MARAKEGVRVNYSNGDTSEHPQATSVEKRESEFVIINELGQQTIVGRENLANIEIGVDVQVTDYR